MQEIEEIIKANSPEVAANKIKQLYQTRMVQMIPQLSEMDKAVKDLAKESTAPDKETPDWMESDIKRGMIWIVNYIQNQILKL